MSPSGREKNNYNNLSDFAKIFLYNTNTLPLIANHYLKMKSEPEPITESLVRESISRINALLSNNRSSQLLFDPTVTIIKSQPTLVHKITGTLQSLGVLLLSGKNKLPHFYRYMHATTSAIPRSKEVFIKVEAIDSFKKTFSKYCPSDSLYYEFALNHELSHLLDSHLIDHCHKRAIELDNNPILENVLNKLVDNSKNFYTQLENLLFSASLNAADKVDEIDEMIFKRKYNITGNLEDLINFLTREVFADLMALTLLYKKYDLQTLEQVQTAVFEYRNNEFYLSNIDLIDKEDPSSLKNIHSCAEVINIYMEKLKAAYPNPDTLCLDQALDLIAQTASVEIIKKLYGIFSLHSPLADEVRRQYQLCYTTSVGVTADLFEPSGVTASAQFTKDISKCFTNQEINAIVEGNRIIESSAVLFQEPEFAKVFSDKQKCIEFINAYQNIDDVSRCYLIRLYEYFKLNHTILVSLNPEQEFDPKKMKNLLVNYFIGRNLLGTTPSEISQDAPRPTPSIPHKGLLNQAEIEVSGTEKKQKSALLEKLNKFRDHIIYKDYIQVKNK